MIPVPANDNFPPDAPVRLADAAKIAFPLGGMTASGLRREAQRGRLIVMRIAGKDFTTLSAIEEMKKACRVPANQPGYGCAQPARTEPRHGLSSTAENSSAQVAARMLVQKLKRR